MEKSIGAAIKNNVVERAVEERKVHTTPGGIKYKRFMKGGYIFFKVLDWGNSK